MTLVTWPDLRTRRWRRVEYERLVELGMFVGERLELLDGQLVVREPQGSTHAALVVHIGQVLTMAFGSGWHARLQAPLALGEVSEPEPDIAIVAGIARDYLDTQPPTAALIVEVADSSLRLARRFKAELYARGTVPEYWIVNLVDRVLEVHRDPEPADTAVEARYLSVTVLRAPATVTPLGAASAIIQ